MVSSSRARRAVAAAVAAAAVASIGAANAEAKTVTLTDDTAAEFQAGTRSDTVVREPGSVEIAPALEEQFGGPALPAGWSSGAWTPGAPPTAAGSLSLDGGWADSGAAFGARSSLKFTATFGAQTNQHAGFAVDPAGDTAPFNDPPWAIFSTGSGPLGLGLYARTSDGASFNVNESIPVTVSDGPHTFRIDRTATAFVYYVDGNQVASHTIPDGVVMPDMPIAASDLDPTTPPTPLTIDSVALRTHTSGTYSHVLDAGDARVTGLSVTTTDARPTGTAIAYETRTAGTAAELASATWTPLPAGGAIANPKRFVEYQATLTTTDLDATPALDTVVAAFDVDDVAPKVTIQDVAVSGRTAKATFGSDDANAKLECSLDGAAFAACASPAEFSGLAPGAHKLDVRATDGVGNVGTSSRSFAIAASTNPPANPPVNPSGNAPDTKAPKVLVMGRSARVSKRGVAKLKIRCPRSEQSCDVTVKLTLGGKRVARKRLELSSGQTRTFRLKLSGAARRKLADRSSLKATATVVAEDAAGNDRTTKHRLTLLAPSR